MVRASVFGELVRHFFGRFFDRESLSPQSEPAAGVFQTLGMLAAPGGIVSILALVFTFERWDLVGFRFLFICFSMAALGVAMVFEWNALFPDRRDYQILTPLPLRTFTLFLAKVVALFGFLGIFLAAANFFGVFFWPSIESRGGFFAIAGTHLLVTSAAGLFSALAIAAFQGVLVTIFRGAVYRKISVCAQTLTMAALIMCFFLAPLAGTSIPALCRANSPLLHWFPAFWFAGLYEQLRPAVSQAMWSARPDPAQAANAARVLWSLGGTALRALSLALAIFLLVFLPGYRRHARRVLETPELDPKGPGWLRRHLTRAADRLLLRNPVERAVFHFIGQTLARSAKHRLFLATYGGFGAALVVAMLASGGASQRIPLTLSFILVSGLRAAFNFPAELRANWVFQMTETSLPAGYARATRKWMLVCAILPLFLLLAPIEFRRASFAAVAFQFAFGVSVSTLLMEALFLSFHKVPFTCSHFPGKLNLVFLTVLYFFGFTFYSSLMTDLESWLWRVPIAVLVFLPAVAGGLAALRRVGGNLLNEEPGLKYEDEGNPAVRVLGLTGQ